MYSKCLGSRQVVWKHSYCTYFIHNLCFMKLFSLYTIVQFYTESFPPEHREDNPKFYWSTKSSWRNEEIHSLNPVFASFFRHCDKEETREFTPEETRFLLLITNQHRLNGLQANFNMSLHPVNFDCIWRTNPFPRIKKYSSHF